MSTLLKQVDQPQHHLNTEADTYIYGLVDPLTGYVRYVGKAHDPIYRLKVHLSARETRLRSHKAHWIRSLLAVEKKPELILLEKVHKSEWQKAERKWIAYYRSISGYPPLTNGTSGGDGVDKGTRPDEETRKKLSAVHKGRKLPPFTNEHRMRLSEATQKAWKTSPEETRQNRIAKLTQKWTHGKRTKTMNARRSKMRKKNACTSEFIGVSKTNLRWRSMISVNGKQEHLGYFGQEVDAARARDRRAIEAFGDGIVLNFPRSRYD